MSSVFQAAVGFSPSARADFKLVWDGKTITVSISSFGGTVLKAELSVNLKRWRRLLSCSAFLRFPVRKSHKQWESVLEFNCFLRVVWLLFSYLFIFGSLCDLQFILDFQLFKYFSCTPKRMFWHTADYRNATTCEVMWLPNVGLQELVEAAAARAHLVVDIKMLSMNLFFKIWFTSCARRHTASPPLSLSSLQVASSLSTIVQISNLQVMWLFVFISDLRNILSRQLAC